MPQDCPTNSRQADDVRPCSPALGCAARACGHKPVQRALKRMVDLVLSAVGLVLLSPLFGVLAALVRAWLGRPVLYRQQRPGQGGEPFTMLKFRTMTTHTGPDGKPLPDAQRLTRFGQWLRSTSLDELPELLNVLSGKMSLVGPRPLLMEYLPLYNARQARRHEVRPGITGWTQVNGRNSLAWNDKFEYDVWYVEHWSLLLDLKILFLTGWSVLSREGVNPEGQDVVEDFTGNEPTSSQS